MLSTESITVCTVIIVTLISFDLNLLLGALINVLICRRIVDKTKLAKLSDDLP